MTDPLPSLDAVIVAWNKRDVTLEAIRHIRESSVPAGVIVVDNGSTDGTAAAVRENFPDVEVVELEENVGFGPGANIGIARSRAEVVAVVNDDADVEPRYFEILLGRFADPRIGFASGVSMNPGTKLLEAGGAFTDGGLNWFTYLGGEPAERVQVDDPALAGPLYIAILFRRAAFDAVGGFDDELFAYWEDVDLTMRLLVDGWEFAIEPSAKVWHRGSMSLGHRSKGQIYIHAWGRGYILGRYRIGAFWLLTEALVTLADAAITRDLATVSRRIDGFRRGRALPARRLPNGMATVSWRHSMRRRMGAV